uniref:Uncharacterized protein n=1 Tax=Phage sp. ct4bw6 TaxID=2826747 RepID=A0A8S5MUR0_9VIRU|nr:MAG TPA: hypothetical protein [Phage sp. ct4bw6]
MRGAELAGERVGCQAAEGEGRQEEEDGGQDEEDDVGGAGAAAGGHVDLLKVARAVTG